MAEFMVVGNLSLGRFISQQKRNQGEGTLALVWLSFFFLIFVVQSNAQPMGHHHMSSLPS